MLSLDLLPVAGLQMKLGDVELFSCVQYQYLLVPLFGNNIYCTGLYLHEFNFEFP